MKIITKRKKIFFLKVISIQIEIFIIIINFFNRKFNKKNNKYITYQNNSKLDYLNNKFAIINDPFCKICGLLTFYIHFSGCLSRFLITGFIPIIDLQSFKNILNGFNIKSKQNPWEYFFNQPFGYKLDDIKKYSKNIYYFQCNNYFNCDINQIYNNTPLLSFYHTISKKYLPIKNKLIKKSNFIKETIFNGSKNVLGILARGTDYLAARPRGHYIPPSPEMLIKDIIEFDKKYNYDWFFISTEDDIIRKKLIINFGNKLKFLKSNINIKYNYTKKEFLYKNKELYNNYKYNEIYLINILILTKCIDLISARTGGAIALFMFSNGFRNQKIYYLGQY